MKKIIVLVLAILLLTGCKKTVEIPDISGSDEATGKSIITNLGLIPEIEYKYNATVEEGKIYSTYPTSGNTVDQNSKIKIFVSKGASSFTSKDSRIEWLNTATEQDLWEFYQPKIVNNKLTINCHNVVLMSNIEWQDRYDSGYISGLASINDSFDKVVPIKAKYSKKNFSYGEPQSFTLEIPLSDLDVQKPTNMYLKLFAKINDVENREIRVNFFITW